MPVANSIRTIDVKDLISDFNRASTSMSSFISPVHHIFHINRIEEYLRLVNFPTKGDLSPRKMTISSFFFLTKGSSIRKKGLTTYEFGPIAFFFTPAYEILTHEYISPDAEGYYAHFNLDLLVSEARIKEVLQEFSFLNFNCYPLVTIDQTCKENVLPILQRLEREYKLGNDCNLEIIRIYMIALFLEIKRYAVASQKVEINAASLLAEQYKNALARHIQHKQKVSEYAEMLSVTPNHLNKCVQQTLNKSALDLLHDMLLLEAKVLLKQTNMTISEIAYKIGRNEPSDFARFFKNKMGITPKEFRATT